MKKLMILVIAVMLMMAALLTVSVVWAESLPPEDAAAEGAASVAEIQPYTWTQLATVAGAAAATLLIVQFLKLPLDRVWKIPTRIVVYLVALLILLAAQYFTGGISWSSAALTVVNAFVAALTAMGAYEMTFARADALRRVE